MPTVVNKVVKYTGGDYTTIQAAIDAAPSNLVTADEQWNILIDEASAGSTAWTVSSTISLGTRTTDATRFIAILANTGKSFRDNVNKATNALRFNASNGVGVTMTGGTGRLIDSSGCANTRFIGLQFNRASAGSEDGFQFGSSTLIDSCIFRYVGFNTGIFIPGGTIVNSLIYCEANTTCVRLTSATVALRNCTIVSDNSAAYGLLIDADSNHVLLNTGIFRVSDPVGAGPSSFNEGASGYNATNNASDLRGTTGNVYNLTTASQFQSLTSGSEDFRAVTSGSLDGAGTRDQTNTGDLDIVGQNRPTSGPSIGAWEAAPVMPVPNPPTGVTAGSITTTGATISWTDASSDETGFKVQTAPSPYSSWTTASGSPTAANATSLAVTGLSPGTTYKARVASTNANGDSAWVESSEFTTSGGQKGRALLLGVG